MRDTPYAKELASVEVDECRLERIRVKKTDRVEYRFSHWPNGKMSPRPLDVTEETLLKLSNEAIKKQVFEGSALSGLRKLLAAD